ncbi:unnamed protein product [Rotaria sp. Silwood1]|nr:unnamed protein product [Rotaria sp. Silwood1]
MTDNTSDENPFVAYDGEIPLPRSVVKEALELHKVTREQFRDYLGPDCPGRYDYGYLCMINDHVIENTTLIGGPFVSGEWSIFLPLGYYPVIIPWLLQNRGNLSMLVHPNTGYEYEDHSIWAMWAGEQWPLDMSIFEKETQTNEFGHYPGDSDNPVCLVKGGVCGDDQLSPSALCCYDLACKAAEIIPNGGSNYTIHRCA